MSLEERMKILDEFEDRNFGRDFQMIAGKEFIFRLAEAGGRFDFGGYWNVGLKRLVFGIHRATVYH
jgi:hypothetical protein